MRRADNFAARHRATTGTVTAVSEYQDYCGENCWVSEYRITVRYRLIFLLLGLEMITAPAAGRDGDSAGASL